MGAILVMDEASRTMIQAQEEEEMHVVGKWIARNLDLKTVILLLGFIIQGIILYSAITNKLTNLDERVTRIEAAYVPASVISAKDATLQQQFTEIKDTQRNQGDDVREIRRMLEANSGMKVQ